MFDRSLEEIRKHYNLHFKGEERRGCEEDFKGHTAGESVIILFCSSIRIQKYSLMEGHTFQDGIIVFGI